MEKEIKTFICHSSDDKDRFVRRLAERLIENDINALYDDWELSYGDSLIELFDRIDECDVFIIVISENSIQSKWVKEELSAGVVKKIDEGAKLIPIVIDEDVIIPPSLKYVKQCRIKDITNYDEEFKGLLNSIIGKSNKPPLGNKPSYSTINPIEGFTQLDSLIIQKMGESLHSKNNMFSFDEIMELTNNEFSKEDVFESLQVLEEKYIINCQYVLSSRLPHHIKLTPSGVIFYCMHYEEEFEIYIKEVVSTLLNENVYSNEDIYEQSKCPKFIVNALLEQFLNNRYIKGSTTISGSIIIHQITGNGRRQLKKLLD